MTVAARRATVALLEPVVVNYSLHNTTDSVQSYSTTMRLTAGGVRVYIEGPDGQRVRFDTRVLAHTVSGGGMLDPGQSRSGQAVLLWHASQKAFVFPIPGEYAIHVEIIVHPGNRRRGPSIARANPLYVSVLPLTAEQELAVDYVGGPQRLRVLQELGAISYCKEEVVACVAHIEDFISKFRASPYAPFVSASLAASIATGRLQGVPQQRSIRLAKRFLRTWPDHALGRSVTEALLYRLDQSGRHKEAERVFAEYAARWPEDEHHLRLLEYHVVPQSREPLDLNAVVQHFDAVFTGEVVSVEELGSASEQQGMENAGNELLEVELRVIRAYKGAHQATITVLSPASRRHPCVIRFTPGRDYLVYASGTPLVTSGCTGTRRSRKAQDDLVQLDALVPDALLRGRRQPN